MEFAAEHIFVAGTPSPGPFRASNNWHYAMWDENPATRPDYAGVPRAAIGASQAATIANVKATPGSFYPQPIGNAQADPRGLAGQKTFRFWYRPLDGSNPNTDSLNPPCPSAFPWQPDELHP